MSKIFELCTRVVINLTWLGVSRSCRNSGARRRCSCWRSCCCCCCCPPSSWSRSKCWLPGQCFHWWCLSLIPGTSPRLGPGWSSVWSEERRITKFEDICRHSPRASLKEILSFFEFCQVSQVFRQKCLYVFTWILLLEKNVSRFFVAAGLEWVAWASLGGKCLKNCVVSKKVEPGSVLKSILVAARLAWGLQNTLTQFVGITTWLVRSNETRQALALTVTSPLSRFSLPYDLTSSKFLLLFWCSSQKVSCSESEPKKGK